MRPLTFGVQGLSEKLQGVQVYRIVRCERILIVVHSVIRPGCSRLACNAEGSSCHPVMKKDLGPQVSRGLRQECPVSSLLIMLSLEHGGACTDRKWAGLQPIL